MDEFKVNKSILRLKLGDITRERVDVIVNAANSRLAGGGGVDGAIHRAGGPRISEECRKYAGCPTGQAVITLAGDLSAKYVIHAVGPVYRGRASDKELLASAYRESLKLAEKYGARTISFPAISTGAYGYPLNSAAEIATSSVVNFLQQSKKIDEVNFVLYNNNIYQLFVENCKKLIKI